MAAPFFSTPFHPYVYQSSQEKVTAFQIIGGEGQVVQIMLKSQEKITAKPGAVCYMSESIQMDNIIFHENEAGMWQWLLGKNVSSTILSNVGADDGYVGISAPFLGRIIPVDLANFGGELLIQPDTFLCSINDVAITNTLDLRANHVFTGVEVFLKQKLVGQGLSFLVGGGSVVQKILDDGEVLVTDVACLVAMTNTIDFQLKHANPVRRALFGGENQITVSLTGPGVVFIQSLPFHRLYQQIIRAGPPGGKENPKFLLQMVVFFLLANVIILSTLLLSGV